MTRTAPRARAQRGFSLVELMIALGISAIVIAGSLALLIGQQRAFQTGSADRALQETARVALESVTSELRMAGFGMEPALVFDFGAQAAVPMPRASPGTTGAVATVSCGSAVACRDRTDGPDELVFYHRNPSFGYALAQGYAGDTLHLTGPLRSPIYKGQLLQVMCFSGSMYWAYVKTASFVDATADADVPVTIESSTTSDFPRQNAILADGCFGAAAPQGSDAATAASAAKVYKIERFRYYIATYDATGNIVAWGTVGGRPHLMLDQGLTDKDGVPVLSVVAPDVEDLQLAYIFPASAPGLQLIGATSGTAVTANDQGIDLAPAAGVPLFGDESDAPSRTTQHPANIRGVKVSLVVRSPEADARVVADLDNTLPPAGNRAAVVGPAGHRRLLVETTVTAPNLAAGAPYFPIYSSGTDQLNKGGG
jgi:type IV pilus assembly protein PilW